MVVFVSNYLNHHQIPFCNAMHEFLRGDFIFIQTEHMEEERLQMGWQQPLAYSYLHYYYEQPEECRKWIINAELVLFGGCDDESYIQDRLRERKPIFRYSERLYKTGQWKAVSPRGLRRKYLDHTRYWKDPVYLLCAGAYVASDFSIVHAYRGKRYRWGYFPETRHYDLEMLLEHKGWNGVPYLVWAARMISWKHPELAIQTAAYLKQKGLKFHMDIIGGGAMEEKIKHLLEEFSLEDCVSLTGFLSPLQVREVMEKADIYLFTSDREEGWGAVANEAMNSGCALVANHMIGAAPYLVKPWENGLLYEDGNREELFTMVERLVRDKELVRDLGRQAYHTIVNCWNAENAASRLLSLWIELKLLDRSAVLPKAIRDIPEDDGPCTPAPVAKERTIYRELRGKKR